MKKQKIILSIIVFAIIMLILTISNATDIKVEKSVPSTDGSVRLLFSGLKLDNGSSYQWAIEKTKGTNIINWYDVTAPSYSTGEIVINVNVSEKNQLAVLKATDTAYVSIKKVGASTNIVTDYTVDLTLPLLKAYTLTKDAFYDRKVLGNPAYSIGKPYGILNSNIQICWKKITDKNIVDNYIDKNHDLSGLNLATIKDKPSLNDTTWQSLQYKGFNNSQMRISNGQLPEQDGLYYLWIMGSGEDIKTVYGYQVVEVGTVTKITSTNTNTNQNKTDSSSQSKDKTSQDKKTNTNNSNNKNNTSSGTKASSNSNAKNADSTTAKTILPYTGISIAIISVIIILIIFSIMVLRNYNKYKDIK